MTGIAALLPISQPEESFDDRLIRALQAKYQLVVGTNSKAPLRFGSHLAQPFVQNRDIR